MQSNFCVCYLTYQKFSKVSALVYLLHNVTIQRIFQNFLMLDRIAVAIPVLFGRLK